MWNLAVVAGAGALGSTTRYAIALALRSVVGERIGWATLVVNALGSLAIGVVMHLALERDAIDERLKLALATGFLGGFTTFSAFAFDALALARERPAAAVAYVALSVSLGLAGAWLGWTLSARVVGP